MKLSSGMYECVLKMRKNSAIQGRNLILFILFFAIIILNIYMQKREEELNQRYKAQQEYQKFLE